MKFSYKDLTARFASLLGGQEEKPKEEAKPAVETAESTPQNDEGFHAFASAVTKAIENLGTQMSKLETVATKENETLKASLASVQSELANLKKQPIVAETAVSGVVEQKETSNLQLSASEKAQIEIMQFVRDAKAAFGK